MDATSTAALRLVIVDDDADIRALIAQYMGMQGIEVAQAASEAELIARLDGAPIQVALLDVNLGREDGFAIARRLRERSDWHGGIIMLTGRGDVVDRVVGLEVGADDYVAKPFDLRELLARVKSVARRVRPTAPAPQASGNIYRFGNFSLDLDARRLQQHAPAQQVELTSGEFELLAVLVQNAQRVMSRDQLLRSTHNRDAAPFDRTVDVQIGRLRKKLGDVARAPVLIKSVRGAGYLLATPVQRKMRGPGQS